MHRRRARQHRPRPTARHNRLRHLGRQTLLSREPSRVRLHHTRELGSSPPSSEPPSNCVREVQRAAETAADVPHTWTETPGPARQPRASVRPVPPQPPAALRPRPPHLPQAAGSPRTAPPSPAPPAPESPAGRPDSGRHRSAGSIASPCRARPAQALPPRGRRATPRSPRRPCRTARQCRFRAVLGSARPYAPSPECRRPPDRRSPPSVVTVAPSPASTAAT